MEITSTVTVGEDSILLIIEIVSKSLHLFDSIGSYREIAIAIESEAGDSLT